jgi:hypothetical protein
VIVSPSFGERICSAGAEAGAPCPWFCTGAAATEVGVGAGEVAEVHADISAFTAKSRTTLVWLTIIRHLLTRF